MMSTEGGTVGAMKITNGLYSIHIEMTDGGHGRAHGVIMLFDGKIAGCVERLAERLHALVADDFNEVWGFAGQYRAFSTR